MSLPTNKINKDCLLLFQSIVLLQGFDISQLSNLWNMSIPDEGFPRIVHTTFYMIYVFIRLSLVWWFIRQLRIIGLRKYLFQNIIYFHGLIQHYDISTELDATICIVFLMFQCNCLLGSAGIVSLKKNHQLPFQTLGRSCKLSTSLKQTHILQRMGSR